MGKTQTKKEIIWPRSATSLPVICQYPEGFRWVPWTGKLTSDKFGTFWNVVQKKQIDWKSIKILYNPIGQLGRRNNRWRFSAILLAGFAIDRTIKNKPNRIFTWCATGIPRRKFKFNYCWQLLPPKWCKMPFEHFKILTQSVTIAVRANTNVNCYCIICIVQEFLTRIKRWVEFVILKSRETFFDVKGIWRLLKTWTKIVDSRSNWVSRVESKLLKTKTFYNRL